MRAVWAIGCCALAGVAACGRGEEPAKVRTASAPARPDPAESRHLVDLGSRNYPTASAEPAEAIRLRFDFSGKRVYAFDYHQRVAATTDMGLPQGPGGMDHGITSDGALLMKSKGGGLGTMVLKDVKATMSMAVPGEAGVKDRAMNVPMATMVVPEVKEDGSMEGGAVAAQPLLKLLFPLPPHAIKKGESVDVPLSMPFNMMGSPLSVKGTGRITLKGFVTIEDRTCARLDVEIDISKLDVPEEVETKAAFSAKGRSVYYWDVERQEFASGETALLMKMSVDGAMPKPPAGAPTNLPSTLKMKMISDNFIRLTRNPELAARDEAGK